MRVDYSVWPGISRCEKDAGKFALCWCISKFSGVFFLSGNEILSVPTLKPLIWICNWWLLNCAGEGSALNNSGNLRQIFLILILMRVRLTLDIQDLKKAGRRRSQVHDRSEVTWLLVRKNDNTSLLVFQQCFAYNISTVIKETIILVWWEYGIWSDSQWIIIFENSECMRVAINWKTTKQSTQSMKSSEEEAKVAHWIK